MPLTNCGTINWAGGVLRLYNDGVGWLGSIYNEAGGVFDVQGNLLLNWQSGLELFRNQGTFRKSAGTSTATINPQFDNSGTVEVLTGTLQFVNPGNGTHTGNFIVSPDNEPNVGFTRSVYWVRLKVVNNSSVDSPEVFEVNS